MVTRSTKALAPPVARLENAIVTILLAAVVALSFGQIVARWFGGGWIWIDELVRYLVLWLGMFGAVVATRTGKHIAIDALVGNAPANARRWLARAANLVAGVVALAFLRATVSYIRLVGDETSDTLGVTVGTLTWPVALAFALIGLHFFYRCVFGADTHSGVASPLGAPTTTAGRSHKRPLT